jgi:hypothetical protein
MHPNCEALNDILQAAGLPGRVRMLDEAVTTATGCSSASSAEHPKSLGVCAAQAAPRCVLVVAHRTPLWDSSSALRCIHLDDAYRQGSSNARHYGAQ